MRSASPSALLSTLIGWLGEETRARARARWRRCLRRWRFHSRLAPAPPPRCSLASVLRPASRPRPAARHQRCSGKVYVASTTLVARIAKALLHARFKQRAAHIAIHSDAKQLYRLPACRAAAVSIPGTVYACSNWLIGVSLFFPAWLALLRFPLVQTPPSRRARTAAPAAATVLRATAR